MNTLIIILTILLALAGISVAIWSFIDTRNRFYKEFTTRKRK